MNFDMKNVGVFKKVIEDIIDEKLNNYGITSYISAIVTKVNDNGTVNVVIPPTNNRYVNNLLNKSNETLNVGDSVELCTKNGRLSNAWVAVKHGVTNPENKIIDNFPIGSIISFSGTSIPNNWLLADGSEVSRETYPELFQLIGTTYGDGDGSTTFNLPDMRGKIGVGLSTDDNDFGVLGNTTGEKQHVLTTEEQPHLTGQLQFRDKSGDNIVACYPNLNTSGVFTYQNHAGAQWSVSINSGGTAKKNALITFDNGGQDAGHNNIQPSLVVNYIIKVSKDTSYITPSTASVIDNLTNTSITDALSANMGKQLNENIASLSSQIGSFYLGSFTPDSAATFFLFNNISLSPGIYQMFGLVQTNNDVGFGLYVNGTLSSGRYLEYNILNSTLPSDGQINFSNNSFVNSRLPRMGVGTSSGSTFFECTFIINEANNLFYSSKSSCVMSGRQRLSHFSGVVVTNNQPISTIGLSTENSNTFNTNTIVYLFKKGNI